jgi:predicted transcriptional regulator of viral defense system
METSNTTKIIKILKENNIFLFSLSDFERLFDINNKNTLYKKIQRLEAEGIVQKLKKGYYHFLLAEINDFILANFLYQPSYISLESALSFYGIITGFPYQITSLTPKKSKTYFINNKEFRYSKINPSFFWGYQKKDEFLIAEKEKAIIDYVYFHLKGLKNFDPSEFNLNEIDKKKLFDYGKRFKNQKLIIKIRKLYDYQRTNS